MATSYQFFRPLAYVRIKGPTLALYRIGLPLVATGLVCALYYFLPVRFELVGDKSVSDYLIS